MNITPIEIIPSGPGVDLSDQPAGLSVEMLDPLRGSGYALNAVTLVFDLAGFEGLRLVFRAMEFGDEPHAPPPGPFDVETPFDGVAVSIDGVDWYEIQNLRDLRSDKFLYFDIDLDAAISSSGLTYSDNFRIRFCQYDNNPAPMDGIFLRDIRLTDDPRPAILHMPMDDRMLLPRVIDLSPYGHDQVFFDPGGNANTLAHSVPGIVSTALSFDGVDDRIHLKSESYRAVLEAGRDFSVAFWWKTTSPDPAKTLHFLSNYSGGESSFFFFSAGGNVNARCRFATDPARWVGPDWVGGADDAWHHYCLTRQGSVLSFYRDGTLALSDENPDNALSLVPLDRELTLGSNPGGSQNSPGAADDFRVYDRALTEGEIQQLAGGE